MNRRSAAREFIEVTAQNPTGLWNLTAGLPDAVSRGVARDLYLVDDRSPCDPPDGWHEPGSRPMRLTISDNR